MHDQATESRIRQIYSETIDALYAYASRRCGGDRALAEDVTQEAWLRAVREWRQAEVERAAANLRLAQDRAALANSGKVRGIVSEIDARRAELEALELSAMLKRLRAALDGIEKQN